MSRYTIHVPAILAFQVEAETRREAHDSARETALALEPMEDVGVFSSAYPSPWVAIDLLRAEAVGGVDVVDEDE